MKSLNEILPTYFEKIKMAEIEPGFILMILIWLFSSFSAKKKSKKKKSVINTDKVSQKFESLIRKLGDLPELDISKPQKIVSDSEDMLFDEKSFQAELNHNIDDENSFSNDKGDLEPSVDEIKSKLKPIVVNSFSRKEIKLYGTSLQKVMILNEILDKPRALKPFSFEK